MKLKEMSPNYLRSKAVHLVQKKVGYMTFPMYQRMLDFKLAPPDTKEIVKNLKIQLFAALNKERNIKNRMTQLATEDGKGNMDRIYRREGGKTYFVISVI